MSRATARRFAYAAIAAWLAFATVACGVPTSSEPTLARDRDVPFGLLATSTTTTSTTEPPSPVARPLIICVYRDTQLVLALRPSLQPGVAAALEALRQGLTPAERRGGLTSAVVDPSVIANITPRAGVGLVDLAPSFTAAGPGDQLRIIAQLVCSVTAQPGIGQVLFTLAGNPVEVPRGDGSVTAAPVSRDDYAAMIASA